MSSAQADNGVPAVSYDPTEACARKLDAQDPLSAYREHFHIPTRPDGTDLTYFLGNSLGLQPRRARSVLDQVLADWARFGVEAYFSADHPWYEWNGPLSASGARLVGALPGEVVMMNSLTVNLHLLMTTFYRPTPTRSMILMEDAAFPSDTYAAKSQIRRHGLDPAEALLIAKPRAGRHVIAFEDIAALLEQYGSRIAMVLLGGVHFLTGQAFDVERITAEARRYGCVVGFDLAHAVGNVPLRLHDWQVDFAVWCSYKYLNAGPGAVAGCFVHEQHGRDPELPRLAGWWGNDPKTRFRMQLEPEFIPVPGAAGWQISTPSIVALAPLKASLELFDEVGMPALREKSLRLTGYLEYLIDQISPSRFELITPRDPACRGCQLSLAVHDRPQELLAQLEAEGMICDFREPNVIRVAPTPFYNTFHEVWNFSRMLARHDRARRST